MTSKLAQDVFGIMTTSNTMPPGKRCRGKVRIQIGPESVGCGILHFSCHDRRAEFLRRTRSRFVGVQRTNSGWLNCFRNGRDLENVDCPTASTRPAGSMICRGSIRNGGRPIESALAGWTREHLYGNQSNRLENRHPQIRVSDAEHGINRVAPYVA